MSLLVFILALMYIYPPWIVFSPDEESYEIKYGLRWSPPSGNTNMTDGVYELVGRLYEQSFLFILICSSLILTLYKEKRLKKVP